MEIDRIHQVAYRCRDAKETVLWFQKMLKMDFVLAIAEDLVPSTKAPDPYMHTFLDAGGGNILAFFELPTRSEHGLSRRRTYPLAAFALMVIQDGGSASRSAIRSWTCRPPAWWNMRTCIS